MKKKISIIVGALLLITVLIGMRLGNGKKIETVRQDTREIVKIAYLPTTHSLALIEQAKLQKDNPKYRLELVKYGTWPDLTDALNAGQVDGAVVLTELAMKAKSNGVSLQAVALGHRDGNIVVADKSIGSVKELLGKTIAIPSKLSSHYVLLQAMLEQNGLQVSDVNIVELAPSEMPFALVSGQIAAYCVAEPFGGKAIHAKVARVLFESDDLWKDSICCALVFQEKFLERNIAKDVINDYIDAGNVLDQDKKEAEEIGVKYLQVDRDVLKVSLQWISFNNLAITKEAYDSLCDKLAVYHIMERTPSYETFIAENSRKVGEK